MLTNEEKKTVVTTEKVATHLSQQSVLFFLLLQKAFEVVDVHLCLCQSPCSLMVLLSSLSRKPLALQHLQKLLDGFVPSVQGLLLSLYPQLHLLQSLSKEEQLLGLPLVLSVQPLKVLLRQLCHTRLTSPTVTILLKQLVQVPLDPQFILESLDCHLHVLV